MTRSFLSPKGPSAFTPLVSRNRSLILTPRWAIYVTVPVRAPHTFSNPFDEEAKFFNTFTPACYVNYFKLMADMAEKIGEWTPEINQTAMSIFATMPVGKFQKNK